MRKFCLVAMTMLSSSCADADVGRLMNEYLWEKRVIVMFAPSAEDTDYQKLLTDLSAHRDALQERDLVVWEIIDSQRVRANFEQQPHLYTQPFYDYFNVASDRFSLILLGKDGEEELRQSDAQSAKSIFALIDSMPMRQREMAE